MTQEQEPEQEQNGGERLSRFLAHAGIASRRHAVELIHAGRVQVNGVIVTTQGTRIHPEHDTVRVDGNPVRSPTRQIYILLHNSMEKHYHALVQGCPSESSLAALRSGVTITTDNGRIHKTAPARVHLLEQAGNDCWLELTIHEGRKRQIRRMLTAVGHPVLKLIRVGIGPLELGDIPAGEWRYLTNEEVKALQGSYGGKA